MAPMCASTWNTCSIAARCKAPGVLAANSYLINAPNTRGCAGHTCATAVQLLLSVVFFLLYFAIAINKNHRALVGV